MTRRALAVAALALLAVTGGCAAFGGGSVDQDRLRQDADYAPYWGSQSDVTVVIGPDSYRSLVRVENRSEIELYRFHRFNNERPLDIAALAFRYPNGTVVGADAFAVERTGSRTVVDLPASEGTVAYTAPKRGKRVRVATVVDGGSYEVILPPDAEVKYFLLGRVVPRGYERSLDDGGQVHLTWEAVQRDRIVVRYYLGRDLVLFGGLLAIAVTALVGGLGYFLIQLRDLRTRREAVALDEGDGP